MQNHANRIGHGCFNQKAYFLVISHSYGTWWDDSWWCTYDVPMMYLWCTYATWLGSPGGILILHWAPFTIAFVGEHNFNLATVYGSDNYSERPLSSNFYRTWGGHAVGLPHNLRPHSISQLKSIFPWSNGTNKIAADDKWCVPSGNGWQLELETKTAE